MKMSNVHASVRFNAHDNRWEVSTMVSNDVSLTLSIKPYWSGEPDQIRYERAEHGDVEVFLDESAEKHQRCVEEAHANLAECCDPVLAEAVVEVGHRPLASLTVETVEHFRTLEAIWGALNRVAAFAVNP